MKTKLFLLAAACAAILGATVVRHHMRSTVRNTSATNSNDAAVRLRALEAYGKIPLAFEANSGQTDARVKFLARGSGYTVFLTDRDATLRLERPSAKLGAPGLSAVVRFALDGANSQSVAQAIEPQVAKANYFVGNDPTKWHRNVPEYSRVHVDGVYPGIDLVYYGSQGRLESDYVVRPGADPKQIALRVEGAERIQLNADGDAILSTTAGDVSLHQPRAYQESIAGRIEVAANYVSLASGALGIRVDAYDAKLPLVIDPVVGYATFLSGSTGGTTGNAIAVDSAGNAYIVGATASTDFPTTSGAFQKTRTGATGNAFVTKLNAAGTALGFSTYLGGSGATGGKFDSAAGVAVDASGNVYITGATPSTDFPIKTQTAYQVVNNGAPGNCFFTKLDPTGSTLLYSTYLGGSGNDACTAIALDSNGNAYVTGTATSNVFPVTPGTAIQTAGQSTGLAFISRFNTSLSGTQSLVYSTLLGGTSANQGTGIAVDASFNAYITGQTTSTDFPVSSGAFQTTLKGSAGNAFVSRVDTTTSNNLVYSTYLGGTATGAGAGDIGNAIAVGTGANVFVTGDTAVADFPVTTGVLQSTPKNTTETTFVARLDTTKSGAPSLLYSTYLGGSSQDAATSIAADTSGNAYVAGVTLSSDFPTLPGAPQFTRTTQNREIGYVSVLNSTGTALSFSTYFGGSAGDAASGVAIDGAAPPNIYITGATASSDFPVTTGAFQTTFKTGAAFVAKLSPAAVTGVILAPASVNFGNQGVNSVSAAKTVILLNASTAILGNIAVSITGTDASSFAQTHTCGTTLAVGASCTISVTFKPTATGAATATLSVADSDASTPQTAPLTGTGASSTTDFSIAAAPASVSVAAGATGTSTVTVTGLNGFTSAVALTCTGAPAASTCTLIPTSVTATSSGATSTATITTTSRTSPTMAFRIYSNKTPGVWTGTLALIALGLTLFVWMIRRIETGRKLAWTAAALLAFSLTSCSGVPTGGTPAGTYTITITGTSGSLTHSTTVTLTVT